MTDLEMLIHIQTGLDLMKIAIMKSKLIKKWGSTVSSIIITELIVDQLTPECLIFYCMDNYVGYGGSVADALSVCLAQAQRNSFPNMAELPQILSVMPVSSCEAERAFSKMKLVKTSLSSTMSHAMRINIHIVSIMHTVSVCFSPNFLTFWRVSAMPSCY